MLNFASAKRHPFIICEYVACPAGATAQPLGAGCLLAAMPLRDSRALWVLCRFTNGVYPLRGKSLFCLPDGGQTRFFFCLQKKKRVWTPKRKR